MTLSIWILAIFSYSFSFIRCIFSYFSSSKIMVYLTIDVIIYLVILPSLVVHKLIDFQASGALYALKCGVISPDSGPGPRIVGFLCIGTTHIY